MIITNVSCEKFMLRKFRKAILGKYIPENSNWVFNSEILSLHP
jgi:hypothetical protein